MLAIVAHDAGRVPTSELELRLRVWMLVMFAHDGRGPSRLFPSSTNCSKEVRLLHDEGSDPRILLEGKETCVTSAPEHVTPCHSTPQELVMPHPALLVHSCLSMRSTRMLYRCSQPHIPAPSASLLIVTVSVTTTEQVNMMLSAMHQHWRAH